MAVNEPKPGLSRTLQPAKGIALRFAYMFLVLGAFGLMMLGKVDYLLVERYRTAVTDALAPMMDVLSRPVDSVADVVRQGHELLDLRAENERLRTERDRLLQWQARARELDAQNRSLRDLLNFVPDPDSRFIAARVVADTGGAFAHAVLVNAGSREGVTKGQAVVTGDGLVGRVAGVGGRSSRVLLITDLNSRIPVAVADGRHRAILAGDNSERPRLVHSTNPAMIAVGDRVVTSGHGGAFPPDLPIGRVATVKDGVITVKPLVDRERIDTVRIIDYGLTGILADVDAVGALGSASGNGPAHESQ